MKKIFLLFILCLLFFTSCASSNENIILDKKPSWITNEIIDENTTYYIISGEGDSLDSAINNAIEDFYFELTKSVNIEDKSIFINDLIENYYYSPLELRIIKRYEEQLINNSYKIYYLLSANKTNVEESVLKKIEKDDSISKKLTSLDSESNLVYRDNKDYKSIDLLITAYINAKDNGFDIVAEDFLDIIISRINSLNIRVYAKNNINSLEIRLNRDQGLIDPLVQGAKILAIYNALDLNYNNYLVKQDLIPIKNNYYTFLLDDKNINKKGVIIFKLDFEEQLKVLTNKGYIVAAQSIDKAINERVFSYSQISDFEGKKVIISTTENGFNQEERESVTQDFFTNMLKKQNATVVFKNNVDTTNLEQFQDFGDYLFIFKAELIDEENGIKPYAISHGSLEIYDLSNLLIIYDSNLIDCIAIADTMEESENQSLINVAKKTYHNYL